MYDDLIKRLRLISKSHGEFIDLYGEAADAIEELICEVATEHNERLDAEERQRWISVTERLPKGADKSGEICENVWLLFDDGGVYPGWMNGVSEKAYYINDYDDVIRQAPISCVKMWQPRPQPPKEEEP